MDDYDITLQKLGENEIMPFYVNIEQYCNRPHAYTSYKSNRLKVIKDKVNDRKEPFHLKMLRQEAEEESKRKMFSKFTNQINNQNTDNSPTSHQHPSNLN